MQGGRARQQEFFPEFRRLIWRIFSKISGNLYLQQERDLPDEILAIAPCPRQSIIALRRCAVNSGPAGAGSALNPAGSGDPECREGPGVCPATVYAARIKACARRWGWRRCRQRSALASRLQGEAIVACVVDRTAPQGITASSWIRDITPGDIGW